MSKPRYNWQKPVAWIVITAITVLLWTGIFNLIF